MLKTIFNNISNHRLIIIEDAVSCHTDELFMVLPSMVQSNVQQISSPNVLETPDFSSLVDKNSHVIFVDSISPFIWTRGIRKVSQELKNVTATGKVLVVNVHPDTLLDETDAVKLRYLSSACIQIIQQLGKRKFVLKISAKKKHQTEIVEICENNELFCSAITQNIERPVSKPLLTTFNLGISLSQTEKQARDSLILPYLRKKQESGTIIYNADDADLEEDPDEDLEL